MLHKTYCSAISSKYSSFPLILYNRLWRTTASSSDSPSVTFIDASVIRSNVQQKIHLPNWTGQLSFQLFQNSLSGNPVILLCPLTAPLLLKIPINFTSSCAVLLMYSTAAQLNQPAGEETFLTSFAARCFSPGAYTVGPLKK